MPASPASSPRRSPRRDTGAVLDCGGPRGAWHAIQTATGTLRPPRRGAALVEPAPGDTALLALLPDGVLRARHPEREGRRAHHALRAEATCARALPTAVSRWPREVGRPRGRSRGERREARASRVNAVDGSVAQRLTALVGRVFGRPKAERVRVVAARSTRRSVGSRSASAARTARE